MDRLATVNSNVLVDLRKNKSLDMAVFASIESRGFEEEILSKADTTIQVMYKAFKQAVAQKRFLYPESDCAEKYYIQLEQVAELAPLRGIMKRNYAAALQDDAQQTINKYMKAEVHEVSLSPKTKITRYDDFPRQLARAAELLGENHYLYRTLQARKAYFEGFPLIFGGEFTQEMLQKAGSKFQEALSWDPDMPLALLGMEWFYGFGLAVADSAEYYARRATVNSPTWILPYVKLSVVYSEMLSDFVKSKEYLDLAAKIDSTSPLYWEAEGAYYFFQNRFTEAEVLLNKILATGSTSNCLPCSQKLLVKLYLETGRLEEALIISKQSILSDSSNYTSHISLGTVLTKMGRYNEAEEEFKVASFLSAQKTNPEVNLTYWRSFIYSHQNKMDEAFEAFEQSIKLGYDDYAWMVVDPDMALLRAQTVRWNALMKKYFPDKVKN
jgi:tetratricopeptide (TPR) repeat protein